MSIRARLVIGVFISLVLILGVAALASYTVGKHEAEEILDARLATSARVLEALVARQVEHATISQPIVIPLPQEPGHGAIAQASPLGHPYETKIAFQVWRDDGVLLARSASAPTEPFGPGVAGFSDQILNGETWQVFVLKSNGVSIHVAENDAVRNELVHDLGVGVMTPLIIGAVLLLAVVNILILYGLRPLRELAGRLQARAPDALGRLELGPMPMEIVPVVGALNDLLGRVRLAFEHERRFTDAAAHELRTPLAGLKIHADNLQRASTPAEREQSLARLRQGLDRTIQLAEQMLAYSRAQNRGEGDEHGPVRLDLLVAETAAALDAPRSARGQRLQLSLQAAGEDMVIPGDSGQLGRLVRNLLENASRYGPQDSAIRVVLSVDAGMVVLAITNQGEAIPPALRERVFEPYYCVPGSGSEGCGLGLAIVREIAARHGATVELSSVTAHEGTVVTVRFPRDTPAPGRR